MGSCAMNTTKWRCKRCNTRVEMHYDHTGPKCTPASKTSECPGTFQHPRVNLCSDSGKTITHSDVFK